ncbi:MAG: N-formylglutamate amidohydrolase [Ferrovibrio sp.]|nr:N-formylglutamate amidohydrolase [Ferrovibrio sp.]
MKSIATGAPLLHADEPPACQVHRERGGSAYLLVCDHGGNRLPRALGSLGLDPAELERHIAWDIGAAALACRIAGALDACLIVQPYSRLVIDCNRPPLSAAAIATLSEATVIPGNLDLASVDAAARRREIFAPYHERITAELDARAAAHRPAILVALHSFTPVYLNEHRPWQAGVLYHRDARLGHILLDLLRAEDGLVVGDNQPYSIDDETDYTIPIHGEQRALPHVALEIRQDLLADETGLVIWAERLARLLGRAELLFNEAL